jgi:transposase
MLLGISKRGDRYLRKFLIHGARAVVRTVERKQDARSRWLQGVLARRGKNRAGVAQANKTARLAWVMLAKGERYRQTARGPPAGDEAANAPAWSGLVGHLRGVA